MTRDELTKRLVKIDATPYRAPISPRDSLRREFNKIEEEKDSDNNLDSFFDFEKEMSDIAPARDQVEKINQELNIKAEEVPPVSESFLLMEQDFNLKSGDEDSFFIFSEDVVEPTIYSSNMEELPEIINTENYAIEQLPEVKDGDVTNENNMVKSDLEKQPQENSVLSFKVCKYTKDSGELCKRQAPKNADFCSVHRKLLAKQSE
jgi:hypothetical protein